MLRNAILCLFIGIGLQGCMVLRTSYGPAGPPTSSDIKREGYSETQVAKDIFRVFFREKKFTSAKRSADMLMLRSAELTLQHGFAHFAVLAETKAREHSESVGGPVGGPISVGITFSDSTYANTIQCYRVPPDDVETHDAQVVMEELTGKYGITR